MFQKIAKHRANDASNDVHRTPLAPVEQICFFSGYFLVSSAIFGVTNTGSERCSVKDNLPRIDPPPLLLLSVLNLYSLISLSIENLVRR